MDRPDNFGLLLLLISSGLIFVLASGVSSHHLARHFILKSRFLVLKFCAPPILLLLNIGLFLLIPLAIIRYYGRHYGYQLQPGEELGPMISVSDLFLMLFLSFDIVLICGYALYLVGVLFRWLWGKSAGRSGVS